MRYGIKFGATIFVLAIAACQSADDVCDIDYAAIKAAEIIDIEAGLSAYTRFVVEELSEKDLTEEEIAALDRMEEILANRNRPVDAHDLTILNNADMKLTDPSMWDRADDRKCEQQDRTFSLFCSLYFSSTESTGEYQHRRTALQEVRFAIEERTAGREFEHRMMDFNNLPETSFADIKGVVQSARESVQDRLDLQAACAL